MSLKSLARGWNRFFFQPQSPVPIAVFRIVFGLIVLADAFLLRPDWLTWLGPRGLVTLETMQRIETGARINLFALLPQTAFWANAIWWALVASAILLTMGLFTRTASVLVYVLLASVHQRNLFITNSGDTLLRASAFFLMFAPARAALSLDRLRRIWKGKEGLEIPLRAPWAQRMIQIELSLLYFMTFWNKTQGAAWIDGTAIYYVYHLDQFRRFPLPGIFQELFIVRLETWFTLAAEFSLGVLIWFKELRYAVLLVGVLLHLSLEYSLNVPMFQWTALALYVTFLDGSDLARASAWIRAHISARLRGPVLAGYYSDRIPSCRAAMVLQSLDVFHRLRLVDGRDKQVESAIVLNGPRSVLRIAPALWGIGAAPRVGESPGNPARTVSARSGI